MNYLIAGLPGAGKSHLLRSLKSLKSRDRMESIKPMKLIDLDDYILAKLNKSQTIADFIKMSGEQAFRELEYMSLKDLLSKDGQVVALGGGALTKKVLELEDNHNQIIWLDCSFEICLSRIKDDPARPLSFGLREESVYELFESRAKLACDLPKKTYDQLLSYLGDL